LVELDLPFFVNCRGFDAAFDPVPVGYRIVKAC
jgi:hypothetical protein